MLHSQGGQSDWSGGVSADSERRLHSERVHDWGYVRADHHVPQWIDRAISVCCGPEGQRQSRSENLGTIAIHFSHMITLSLITLANCYPTDFLHSFTDDPTFLNFKKGDLITLIKDDEFSQQRGWVKGQTDRRKSGAVPIEAILILPTLSKPTCEVMVWRCHWCVFLRWTTVPWFCGVLHVVDVPLFQSLLNMSPNQRKDIIQAHHKETGTMERLAPATLKEFSVQYFRYLEIYSILPHVSREILT